MTKKQTVKRAFVKIMSGENKDQMFNAATKLLREAQKKADYALIRIEESQEESIDVKNNTIHTYDADVSHKYLVKVWIDGKEGFSYANQYSPQRVTWLVDNAVKIAKASSPLDYFHGIPEPRKGERNSRYPELCDKKILQLSPDDLVRYATAMIEDIRDDHTTLSEGGISSAKNSTVLINSNGIEAHEESTEFAIGAGAIVRNGKIATYWDSKSDRRYFPLDSFAKNIKETAHTFLHAQSLKKKPTAVVFMPNVFADLLQHAFLDNLNGRNVEKKKSLFVKKKGERICSPNISVIDDGTLDYGIHSHQVDAEGTPMQKTTLIDKGILKNFIYDYNTAKHNNTQSTGNASVEGIAFRNIIMKGPFSSRDSCSGSTTDDAGAAANGGLIVDHIMGSHTSNPLTTAFSISMEHGYYCKDGEKIPVKGGLLHGTMAEVMQNIITIGKEIEQRNGTYTGPVVCKGVHFTRQ